MIYLCPVLRWSFLTLIIIDNVAIYIFVLKVFLESFWYHHNIKYKAFEKVKRDLTVLEEHTYNVKAGLYWFFFLSTVYVFLSPFPVTCMGVWFFL